MSIEFTPDILSAARLVNEFAVAGISLMVSDYLHTLPQEIRLIWPTKMSIPKIIFFAVRYGSFALAILVYFCELSQTFSEKDCGTVFTTISVLEVVLSCLGEVIIYVRVWAFSGCHRKVLYYLVAQYLVIIGIAFAMLGKFIFSVKVTSAAPLVGFSCLSYDGDTIYVSMVYVVMLVSVISLMGVMIIIGIYRYKQTGVTGARSGLFLQFYRDGLVYFLMLGALCIANIACNAAGRHGYQYVMVEMQIYVHSMIATRMILHLREYSEQARSDTGIPTTTVTVGGAHGQSIYAGGTTDVYGGETAELKPTEILKAVFPIFQRQKGRNAQRRLSTLRFASAGESAMG